MSTASLLQLDWMRAKYQLMVEKQKRITSAEDPGSYSSFTEWLKDAVGRRSMKAELSRYCGYEGNQHVNKWLNGSIPKLPATWKLIAEWAQVDYNALRDLIDRSAGITRVPKAPRAKGLARKMRSRIRA